MKKSKSTPPPEPPKPQSARLLTPDEVQDKVKLSATTIWRRECEGKFPQRVRLGNNQVRWVESEVDEWIANLPRGMAS